jgi:hypothetical protein
MCVHLCTPTVLLVLVEESVRDICLGSDAEIVPSKFQCIAYPFT